MRKGNLFSFLIIWGCVLISAVLSDFFKDFINARVDVLSNITGIAKFTEGLIISVLCWGAVFNIAKKAGFISIQ